MTEVERMMATLTIYALIAFPVGLIEKTILLQTVAMLRGRILYLTHFEQTHSANSCDFGDGQPVMV